MSRCCCAVVTALLISISIGPGRAQGPDQKPIGEEIQITPSVLFRGDLARIEPHLDFASCGCVELKFNGKQRLSAFMEVWRDGKVNSRRIGGFEPFEATELSYSLRPIRDDPKSRYRLVIAGAGVTLRGNFELPEVRGEGGIAMNSLTQKISRPAGDPVAIWMMSAGAGAGDFVGGESIETRAKRVEAALVLKIVVGNSK